MLMSLSLRALVACTSNFKALATNISRFFLFSRKCISAQHLLETENLTWYLVAVLLYSLLQRGVEKSRPFIHAFS